MKQTKHKLKQIKLMGFSTRTNNQNEMNPATAKIGALIASFREQAITDKLSNRENPGVTYAIYTEYDSDEHGDYTYFIGEAVSDLNDVPEGLTPMTIQAGDYECFTTEPGPMPQVVIQAWQNIWDNSSLKRAYLTDFEVYDQRAQDPAKTICDVYIGVK